MMNMKTKATMGAVLVALMGFGAAAMAVAEDTLVRVKRITAVDERGVERVLMQDRGGIIVSEQELPALVAKVDRRDIKQNGVYRDIKVEVADAFTTGAHGHALGKDTAGKRVVRMEGTLEVNPAGVNPHGLAVREAAPARNGRV